MLFVLDLKQIFDFADTRQIAKALLGNLLVKKRDDSTRQTNAAVGFTNIQAISRRKVGISHQDARRLLFERTFCRRYRTRVVHGA